MSGLDIGAIQDPQLQDPLLRSRLDRLLRMVKARADVVSQDVYDDQDRLVSPGLSTKKSMNSSVAAFGEFLTNFPEAHQEVRDYLDGKREELPMGWLPSVVEKDPQTGELRRARVASPETNQRNFLAYKAGKMEEWRKENPGRALAADAVNFVADVGTSAAQVPLDVAVGIANLARLDIKPIELKRSVMALNYQMSSGLDFDTAMDLAATEEEAQRETQSSIMRGATTGGRFVGTALGMFATPVKGAGILGKFLGAPSKVLGTGGAVGKAVAGLLAKGAGVKEAPKWLLNLGHSAGAFGAYEALTARGPGGEMPKFQDYAEGALHGVIAGSVIGVANIVAGKAIETILSKGFKKLAPDEKQAVEALRNWGVEKGITPLSQEGERVFMKRLVRQWVDAGAPGVEMPFRRMVSIAIKGGLEGVGFSALDAEFQENFISAFTEQDPEKRGRAIERALETYFGTALGAVGLSVPLKDIVGWQRRAKQPDPAMQRAVWEATQGPKDIQGPQEVEGPRLPRGEARAQDVLFDESRWNQPRQGPELEPSPVAGVGEGASPDALRRASESLQAENQRAAEAQQQVEQRDALYDALFGDAFLQQRQERLESRQEHLTEQGERVRQEEAQEVVQERTEQVEAQRAQPQEQPRMAPEVRAVLEPLARVGWKETAPNRMTIEGTPHYFEIEADGRVRLSKSLRETVNLPMRMRLEDLVERLNKSALVDAMKATQLPGDLIHGSGVVVESGRGEKPSIMRMIRMGQVYEAELGPNPHWRVAEQGITARGRDPLPRDQVEAINTLQTIFDRREDLNPADRALLDVILETLKTVSREANASVGEALEFLPQFLHEIAGAPPIIAGERIKMLAEAMTIKHPGVIVQEMAAEAWKQQRAYQKISRQAEAVAGHEFGEGQTARDKINPGEAKQLLQWARPGSELARQLRDIVESGETREVEFQASEYREAVQAMRETPGEVYARTPSQKRAKFREGAEQATGVLRRVGEKFGVREPDGEGGFVNVGAMVGKLKEGIDALFREQDGKREISPFKGIIKTFGSILSVATDNVVTQGFARDMVDTVREELGPEHAKRFIAALTNQKEVRDRLEPIVREMAQTARTRNKELEPIEWGETLENGASYGFSKGHILKEDALMEKFKADRKNLSKRSRDELALHDRLTKEIRKIAHELGVPLRNARGEGKTTVRAETNRNVLTRQMSSEAIDALQSGGVLRDTLIKALAKLNGWTEQAVADLFKNEGWTEHRGVRKIDPIEVVRQLRFFPDHVRLPSGRIVRVLETNLYRHAGRMVTGASLRLGVGKEFGFDVAKDKDAADAPSRYLELINELPTERQREVMAMALRAFMGMAITKPRVHPDTLTYRIMHALHNMMDVSAASKMTLSPLMNIMEPLGTASAMLGHGRVLPEMAEAWQAAIEGRLGEAIKERMEKGGFALHMPDWIVGGEKGGNEQLRSVTKGVSNLMMLPFDVSQTITDVALHRAVERFVSEMQEGRGSSADRQTLQTLFGFSRAEAQAMVDGRGREADYKAVMENGVSRLSRRGDLPGEKSQFALGRQWPKWVRFTGFFQRQLSTLRQTTMAMRDAKTPEEATDAAAKFAKLMGFNMMAFMAGQSLVKFITGGEEEFLRLWSETLEEPGTMAITAAVGSLLGAPAQVISGSLSAYLSGNSDEKSQAMDQMMSVVLPLSQTKDIYQFSSAMFARAAGNPIGDGPYSGKTPLQQLGYFAGKSIPGLRAAGLFGLSVMYAGMDPELENALKASYRWDRRHAPEDFASGRDTDERAKFLDTMRGAVNRIKEGANLNEIEQFLRSSMPEADDKAIRASFLRRRVVTGASWNRLTSDEQARKRRTLGEPTFELLQGYDTALEAMAARFK